MSYRGLFDPTGLRGRAPTPDCPVERAGACDYCGKYDPQGLWVCNREARHRGDHCAIGQRQTTTPGQWTPHVLSRWSRRGSLTDGEGSSTDHHAP